MADEVRLIDAELLTTNIAQIAKNCARSDAQMALIGRILFMIENMPTIEAEPVKHGRWIDNGSNMWLCSYCKENLIYSETKIDRAEKQRYCSRCGARMDGDSNGKD